MTSLEKARVTHQLVSDPKKKKGRADKVGDPACACTRPLTANAGCWMVINTVVPILCPVVFGGIVLTHPHLHAVFVEIGAALRA